MNFTKTRSLPKLLCALLLLALSNTPAPSQTKNSTPEDITTARELLTSLGYWLNVEAFGFDASLRHALIAFQKIEGRQRTGKLTKTELSALQAAHKPTPVESGDQHIEVDLQRQVLFIVESNGEVSHILPVSSGSGQLYTQDGVTHQAVTPLGRFKIQRKILGWRKSPLGLLYYPNYIHGGVAIHGNPAVPVFPASHGCIRIPMFASQEFSAIAIVGMAVLVHDGTGSIPGHAQN